MKNFSAFLVEAERSFAAKTAQKLNLTHVGYGKYADQKGNVCLLYTSPSPRDRTRSRMPSSA